MMYVQSIAMQSRMDAQMPMIHSTRAHYDPQISNDRGEYYMKKLHFTQNNHEYNPPITSKLNADFMVCSPAHSPQTGTTHCPIEPHAQRVLS
jgi:hypothetical protein